MRTPLNIFSHQSGGGCLSLFTLVSSANRARQHLHYLCISLRQCNLCITSTQNSSFDQAPLGLNKPSCVVNFQIDVGDFYLMWTSIRKSSSDTIFKASGNFQNPKMKTPEKESLRSEHPRCSLCQPEGMR